MKWYPPFGKLSVIIYFVLLVVLLACKNLFYNKIVDYISSFYFIGSIIIGGGHMVLPLMYSEFTEKEYITPEVYW